MESFNDYTISETIYTSPSTLILRGKRDGKTIIIKILKKEHPTVEELARFKAEFDIASALNFPESVRVTSYEKYKNYQAIIFEDIPHPSLAQILEKKIRLKPIEFIEIAITIANAVGKIHQFNVIHQDINPSNILCDFKHKKIKIIDFSHAISLNRETSKTGNLSIVEGTLSYISPEQTGRINRKVDFRTDYYSLGASFYQMLTGQLPFIMTDPIELIHAHIALKPVPPHVLDPSIPEMLSRIIMKLLAKTPEDRYQSMFGLTQDLKKCLNELQETGKISLFELGTEDVYSQFQIPEKLYGRQNEVKSLLSAYERTTQGKIELMMVAGEPGIGKSALIREIYKPVIKKQGYFISGKFEQYKRNIPYSAFTQAFEDLVKQILRENKAKIAAHKKNILMALGKNAQVMIDVVPSLIGIIGAQPAVAKLDSTETQNRFSYVLQNFISAFAKSESPLVLFLDDLQWADLSSLRMLENLMKSGNLHYLFIIGAYRNNKPEETVALLTALTNINPYAQCETITLTPLKKEDVNELIADTLHHNYQSTIDLAEICFNKTAGNPFFLSQLLQVLHKDQLIEFDNKTNTWIWDINKIKKKDITDNVVQLMIDKISNLSETLRALIPIAACIGYQFSVKLLIRLCQKSNETVNKMLEEAQNEGLIFQVESTDNNSIYQFVHDRIQQSAYALLNEQDKLSTHLSTARIIAQNDDQQNIDNIIFDIVDHYNICVDADMKFDSAERNTIIEYNLQACKTAKASAAFEPGLNYIKHSVKCIEKSDWHNNYQLTYAVYYEATDTAYLNSKYELMDNYAKAALTHPLELFDRINITKIQILAYAAQEEHLLALDILIDILKELGVRLPKKPNTFHIIIELMKTKYFLFGKKIPDLLNQPDMTDESKKLAMFLLTIAGSSAYISNPSLLPVITSKIVNLTLRFGNSRLSPSAFSAYGLVLCGYLNDFENGYQFGELSLKIMEKFHEEETKSKVVFITYTFIKHWKDRLKDLLPKYIENFENAMETGDLEYAGFSLVIYVFCTYLTGHPLDDLNSKILLYRVRLQSTGNLLAIHAMTIWHQSIFNLMNVTENPGLLIGEECNEDKIIQIFEKSTNKVVLFYIYFNKLTLNYLFGNYNEAYKNIPDCKKYAESMRGMPLLVPFVFFQSLTLLAISNAGKKRKSLIRKVKSNQKLLKTWVDLAPYNHTQKYYLIEAELAQTSGLIKTAMILYDKALELAKKNEFINDEALINELAGKFYLSLNMQKIAKMYLQEARYCYLLWGAKAKIKQLEQTYPILLQSHTDHHLPAVKSTYTSTSLDKDSFENVLDINAIIKSSQAVSSSIVLPNLLKRLMRVSIENIGAEKGFLLLKKENRYFIEAEGNIQKEIKITRSKKIDEDTVPETIINFVINTKEPVVIENASESKQFPNDPYINKFQPKSILCAPILHHNILIAILYFENNLVEAAFTPDRLEVLKILSSQAAISIENARLYDASERFVPKEFLKLLHKKSILNIELGDSVSKIVTVMFTDIRNYTALTEKLSAQESFALINSYLEFIAPIIRKHHGFILQYIGDAILALFPYQADDALNAAIEMQSALLDFNKRQTEKNSFPINIGYGINTGNAILGLIGEAERMDANVISDAINLASRIESLNKTYKTKLLASHLTLEAVKNPDDFSYRTIDKVKVKGKSNAIVLHEIFFNKTDPIKIRLFSEAFQTYQQAKFQEALNLFTAYLSTYPDDEPAKILKDRCQIFLETGVPKDWDGSFTMLVK